MTARVIPTTPSVVFSTPGLIPIEAFTTFGMSAKPESTNPFGKFGTGLKIAVAVCLRLNQEVVVWRGDHKYTFYTKKEDFRGKEFNKVMMKWERTRKLKDRLRFTKSYHELPFTTELGKHWDLWQAFREFQTNTMDENGRTDLEYWGKDSTHQHSDRTVIVVTGLKFVDEFHDRHRNFLEDGLTVREGSDRIQVLDKPSMHVYFRGVRVWDLKEESQYTYNFLMDIDLTEDRTAKYPTILESYICEHIMQSTDESFLQKTVAQPPQRSFERSLAYRYTSVVPSPTFKAFAGTYDAAPAAKRLVKVAEEKKDYTRLTVEVGKKLEPNEIEAFRELVKSWKQSAKVISDDEVLF